MYNGNYISLTEGKAYAQTIHNLNGVLIKFEQRKVLYNPPHTEFNPVQPLGSLKENLQN